MVLSEEERLINGIIFNDIERIKSILEKSKKNEKTLNLNEKK